LIIHAIKFLKLYIAPWKLLLSTPYLVHASANLTAYSFYIREFKWNSWIFERNRAAGIRVEREIGYRTIAEEPARLMRDVIVENRYVFCLARNQRRRYSESPYFSIIELDDEIVGHPNLQLRLREKNRQVTSDG